MNSIRRSHSPIQLLLLIGESVGNRTVVGQQSQDRDKDIRPSNTDVAGLPGGIKDLGSRSANEGFSRSCLLINICLYLGSADLLLSYFLHSLLLVKEVELESVNV